MEASMPKAQQVQNDFASSRGILPSMSQRESIPIAPKAYQPFSRPCRNGPERVSLRIVEGRGTCELRRGMGREPRAMGLVRVIPGLAERIFSDGDSGGVVDLVTGARVAGVETCSPLTCRDRSLSARYACGGYGTAGGCVIDQEILHR